MMDYLNTVSISTFVPLQFSTPVIFTLLKRSVIKARSHNTAEQPSRDKNVKVLIIRR